MSDLYIKERLQAIVKIADAGCIDHKDTKNIKGFCEEIEDFLNKQDVTGINVGDCISRKKLIEDLRELFGIGSVEDCGEVAIHATSLDLENVINNQPQVQPIDILSLLPPKDEDSYYPDEYADGYAEGWNACIDKIVEMYGKQVE